jgi:glycosyltransferase involved in cell wall biosynthesis
MKWALTMSESALVVTGIYPPESGGPGKFAQEFARWLSALDSRVEVLCYSDLNHINEQGFEVKSVNRRYFFIFRILRMVLLIVRSKKANRNVLAVGAFIEVYLASIAANFGYVAKVPGDIVWERARNSGFTDKGIHDFQQIRLPLKYRIFRWIYTKSLQRAKCVIVPSDGLRKLCIEWGIDSQKIQLTYNSVDTDFFVPVANHGYSFDLITACRLTTWKRVDELIELAAQMGLRLAIAGDGPERTNLEALSKSLSANVVFFGELEKEKLLDLFHRSKYFLLNSEYEGLPHVLIEARAAGIFTFARSGTGSSEVIHSSEDGFIYEDIVELQKVMNYVEMNPKLFISMKNLARLDTLNRFNKNQNFIHILDRVIQKS